VSCPVRCKTCKPGGENELGFGAAIGGLPIASNGVCEHFCSTAGYCGNGNRYKSGDDCRGCRISACLSTSAEICDEAVSGACKNGFIDPNYYDDKDSVQDVIDYFSNMYDDEDMTLCPQCGCKGMTALLTTKNTKRK